MVTVFDMWEMELFEMEPFDYISSLSLSLSLSHFALFLC